MRFRRNILRKHPFGAVVLAAALSACAGDLPTEPFEAFSEAVVQLQQGTDQALANVDETSEDRFLRGVLKETAEGDITKLDQLRIKFDASNPLATNPQTQLPLFLKIEQFKDGTRQMTGVLVSYANLLKTLSAPELLSKDTFDKLTVDLNANANDAITKITQTPSGVGELALFSTLAAESARLYLEQKRRSDLIEILNNNQGTIERFTQHMQDGVKLAANIANQEYDEKFQQVALKMIAGNGPASESVRKTALQELIALDRKFLGDLRTFNSLHEAYGRVSSAHQELARKLSKQEIKLTSTIALLEAGQRLEKNFDQAVVVNKSNAAQAVADQAVALARILEAEADAAQLRAAAAEVEAINANAASDVDPNNAEKRATAEQLQSNASELRALAKIKKTRAEEALSAARVAQQKANEIKTKLLSEIE